jgi:8-hydroxy-5-deazaflavin:NADPH oxidoreductase
MKFGMIGAGTLSCAIAGQAIGAGHDVVFSNSRGPETLGDLVDAFGPQASAGTMAEARAADSVVLAVTWTRVREALGNLPYGKHVTALSHYQTKLRDAPACLNNDGSAAR